MNEDASRIRTVKLHVVIGILLCFFIQGGTDLVCADENYFLNVTPMGWDYGNVPVGTSSIASFDLATHATGVALYHRVTC